MASELYSKRKEMVSVVIPVRDRWDMLQKSLNSLVLQVDCPDFEVIVVDDGSKEPIPDNIIQMKKKLLLRFIHQIPLGISAARNHGIRVSIGSLILFIDSDCYLHPEGLINLLHAVNSHPEDIGFQLLIIGNKSTYVGRIEDIRLYSTQGTLLTSDGHIRYLNTAGFAIRTAYLKKHAELFNTSMIRGEDTYLLYQLAGEGYLPRYVKDSRVIHQPEMCLYLYLLKHFWIGYYTSSARKNLAVLGTVLMTISDRKKALGILWDKAKGDFRDVIAFILKLFIAYPLDLIGRISFSIFGMRPFPCYLFQIKIERTKLETLFQRVLISANDHKSLTLTSIDINTLRLVKKDNRYLNELHAIDICYPKGIYMWLVLYIAKMKRINPINIRSGFFSLCKEIATRNISIALVGVSESVVNNIKNLILKNVSGIKIFTTSIKGNMQDNDNDLLALLVDVNPQIVFIGLDQPVQEYFVRKAIKKMPSTVFWCVGRLFSDSSLLHAAASGIDDNKNININKEYNKSC